MTKVHAKPNMNGDTPATFKTEGRRVHNTCTRFLDAMSKGVEVFHARNYQTLPTAEGDALRNVDLAAVTEAIRAVEKLRYLGIEIYRIGDDNETGKG